MMRKLFKLIFYNDTSMVPGDWNGSPDESFLLTLFDINFISRYYG